MASNGNSEGCLAPPQDWPNHLDHDAEIISSKRGLPAGAPLLDFSAMGWLAFEQLCWWLLTKEHAMGGCQRLGGNGTDQGGIDLFVFDEQHADRLNVFECKAWRDLRPDRLVETVSRFLGGRWVGVVQTFTLILAQPELGQAFAQQWQIQKARLREAGIEGELWTANHLTQKLQNYPDLLSKFFPGAHVESFGNLWMERVGFVEIVNKSVFDPRTSVAQRAKQIIAKSGKSVRQSNSISKVSRMADTEVEPAYRDVQQHGRHWIYKGPWFSVSVVLPDETSIQASAAFDFNQEDLRGITLTVKHDWLLKRFLFAEDAPISDKSRAFIVGKLPGLVDRYLIDFPSCRLILQEDTVTELATVADLLTSVMRDALTSLESGWAAAGFPFINRRGRKVALATLPEEVWRDVGRFVTEHDYANGTSLWHIFDGHRDFLKPCHASATDEYDAGYHSVITASKEEGLSADSQVVMLWEPDDLVSNRPPSSRGWWSCDYTLQWLNQILLPEIRRRRYERSFGAWRRFWSYKEARRFDVYLREAYVARDLRETFLLGQGGLRYGLLKTVSVLQEFFVSPDAAHPYLRKQDVENLYRAVELIALLKRGFPGYVASSLSLDERAKGHDELIKSIQDYVACGRVVANLSVVDHALRAMLEVLGDTEIGLQEKDQALILSWLVPFAKARDDGKLVERHTRWS